MLVLLIRRTGKASCSALTAGHCEGILLYCKTLGFQKAQSRSYLHTLGPKVVVMYILGALGTQKHKYHDDARRPSLKLGVCNTESSTT